MSQFTRPQVALMIEEINVKEKYICTLMHPKY